MMGRREAGDEQPLRRQKTRDRAIVLPLIGLALFVPPVAAIFQLDARIAGLPLTAVYLFGVWAALIIGAALLSRELRDELDRAAPPSAAPHGSSVAEDGMS